MFQPRPGKSFSSSGVGGGAVGFAWRGGLFSCSGRKSSIRWYTLISKVVFEKGSSSSSSFSCKSFSSRPVKSVCVLLSHDLMYCAN